MNRANKVPSILGGHRWPDKIRKGMNLQVNEKVVDQFCFKHDGKHKDEIPVMANRPTENPVRHAAIEFDILVKMIWFLLKVYDYDGKTESKGGFGLREMGRF
ncbi:hypothetical protein Hanom_Chr17g01564631 [Helianthus anomalus]